MAIIPNSQKFHTVSSTVNTVDRGSAGFQSDREIYTMQDIVETVDVTVSPYITGESNSILPAIPTGVNLNVISGGSCCSHISGGDTNCINGSYF